jgi:oxygen-independent coproporphyrinogen-3 oxidase
VELFEARTGLSFTGVRDTIDALVNEGLLESDAAGIRATALGRRFLDDVIGRFFTVEDEQRNAPLATDAHAGA